MSLSRPASMPSDPQVSFHRPGRQGWLRWLWSRQAGRLEAIRQLMLSQLTSVADAEQRAALAVKIKSAADPEELWALRAEWMDALAATQGGLIARQRMSDISFMFAGMLDRAQHARTGLEMLQAGSTRGLVRTAAQRRADH